MADPVSSLYGPGAMICWICTSLSVYLSWSFNYASQRHDRFTSDVLGCLLLPAIAAIHWTIELIHFDPSRDEKANQITNAAFTVCMYFMPVGMALSLLAYSHRHKRRLAVTLLTTVPCVVIFAITVLAYGSKAPRVDTSGGGLGCFLVFLVLIPTSIPSRRNSAVYQTTDTIPARYQGPTHRFLLWSIRIAMFVLQWAGFIVLFLLQAKDSTISDSLLQAEDNPFDDASPKIAVLPRTPYRISDIDQAVALSIGIITFLLALFDTTKNYRFRIGDEFDYWRARSLEDIEHGDAKVNPDRWKKDVDYIERKANCAATRVKHHKREKKVMRSLPVVIKKCLERRRPDGQMKALGFI